MQSGYRIGGMLTSTQPRVKVKKDKRKKNQKKVKKTPNDSRNKMR